MTPADYEAHRLYLCGDEPMPDMNIEDDPLYDIQPTVREELRTLRTATADLRAELAQQVRDGATMAMANGEMRAERDAARQEAVAEREMAKESHEAALREVDRADALRSELAQLRRERAEYVSPEESRELQDILRTLAPTGRAFITSARELVATYDALRAELAAAKEETARRGKAMKSWQSTAEELDRQVTLNRENWRIDAEEKDRKIAALTAERDQLRKERDEARRQTAMDTECIERIQREAIALELERDSLRDDKERLDWLEAHNKGTFGIWPDGNDQSWTITGEPTDSYSGGIPIGSGPTLRAAIDTARAAQPRKEA